MCTIGKIVGERNVDRQVRRDVVNVITVGLHTHTSIRLKQGKEKNENQWNDRLTSCAAWTIFDSLYLLLEAMLVGVLEAEECGDDEANLFVLYCGLLDLSSSRLTSSGGWMILEAVPADWGIVGGFCASLTFELPPDVPTVGGALIVALL